jgi:hypothetical protein
MSTFTSSSPERRGRDLARLLHRFWAEQPPAAEAPCVRLSTLAQLQGVGAIAYRRTAGTAEGGLRDAYLMHRLRSRALELRLGRVVDALARQRIAFVVWKGWSLARLYPERCLRPYGDIDILVRAADLPAAERAVAACTEPMSVDLADHFAFAPLRAEHVEPLLARAVLRPHGDRLVPCLSPEDELRLTCLHALKHGLERPLWLCDVALLLELGPQLLEPQRVLSSTLEGAYIGCVMQLARDVLGARVPACLRLSRARAPAWMERALLAHWGRPRLTQNSRARRFMRSPRAWRRVLLDRVPNPITAKITAHQPPDGSHLSAQLFSAWAALRWLRARSMDLPRALLR